MPAALCVYDFGADEIWSARLPRPHPAAGAVIAHGDEKACQPSHAEAQIHEVRAEPVGDQIDRRRRSKIREKMVLSMGKTLSPAPRMALLRVKKIAKNT